MAKLPLEGVRVICQAIVWAGPYATMILADMGAEVIEIEPIQKLSQTRCFAGRFPPPGVEQTALGAAFPNRVLGERHWDRGSTFNYGKRNCKSVAIDWSHPRGRELFLELVKKSDVFFENNAADVMDKLGITYELLKEANPQIIVMRFPGYGVTGSYAPFKGYGANVEAVVGHTWLRAYRDRDPSQVSAIYHGDPTAGTHTVFAILSALHYRRQTGKGQFIDMSQAEGVIHHLGHAYMDYAINRRNQDPWGNRHPSMAPHNTYPCAGEDDWIAIAVSSDEEFEALCHVLGQPGLAEDERFADAVSRYNNQDELDGILGELTKDQNNYDLMHRLQKEGVTAGAVLKQTEMFNDPHLKARGYFEEVTHPLTGPIVDGKETPGTHLYPGPLGKLSKTPLSIRTPAPTLGQDNEYVYKEILGLSDAEYQQILEERIAGDTYLDDAT